MTVTVKIAAEGASSQAAQRRAEQFQDLVRRAAGLTIERAPDAPPQPGEKGAAFEIGAFVMGLATSGAITALVQVLSHYLGKARKTSVSFETPDGAKMSVSAENLAPDQVEETTRRLKAVFEGS